MHHCDRMERVLQFMSVPVKFLFPVISSLKDGLAKKKKKKSTKQHDVIWFGHDLNRCPSLPKALYAQTKQETITIKQYDAYNGYETIMNIILSVITRKVDPNNYKCH